MAGGELESLDFDAFYDLDDFAIEATVNGVVERGLFDRLEIADEDRYGTFPVFRCLTRFDEGAIMTLQGVDYNIEAVQPLESNEFNHVLKLV